MKQTMSPVPKKSNAMTYSFPNIVADLIFGRRITRLEWASNDEYGLVKDGQLMIFTKGAFHQWLVSEADLKATDWVFLPEPN